MLRHTLFIMGLLAIGIIATVKDTPPNMNGLYTLSPTGGANPNATKSLFPKNFKDYPGGVEYFDVYSPTIKSLYSQVGICSRVQPPPIC